MVVWGGGSYLPTFETSLKASLIIACVRIQVALPPLGKFFPFDKFNHANVIQLLFNCFEDLDVCVATSSLAWISFLPTEQSTPTSLCSRIVPLLFKVHLVALLPDVMQKD